MVSDAFGAVRTVLDRYQRITVRALLATIPNKEPRRHLYDLVADYPNRPGKGFRPGLSIATCRAYGGEIRDIIRTAVAIELFHNAFLVHDDVEDGSEYRRGGSTMHTEHGESIAINVGDAMNVLAIRPLMENIAVLGPDLAWKVFAEVEHMVRQSVEGQAIELGWVRDNTCDLSEADYLRMTLMKTCWYTCIHPCRIGALVGAEGAVDLDTFNRFGFYMGAAFQIQDDILNLVGDRRKYGKEIGGDIWEGKRTIPLIHLLNSCTGAEQARLRAFLSTPRRQRSPADVDWVYEAMSNYGSIDHARKQSRHLAGAALYEFSNAYGGLPDSEDKQFVRNIILYMIQRDL